MRARLVPGGRVVEVEVDGRVRVSDLLRRLGFAVEEAVVIRGGRPLTEDEYVSDGDEVEVVRVLSGG